MTGKQKIQTAKKRVQILTEALMMDWERIFQLEIRRKIIKTWKPKGAI